MFVYRKGFIRWDFEVLRGGVISGVVRERLVDCIFGSVFGVYIGVCGNEVETEGMW